MRVVIVMKDGGVFQARLCDQRFPGGLCLDEVVSVVGNLRELTSKHFGSESFSFNGEVWLNLDEVRLVRFLSEDVQDTKES